jgi:hypothetical protein
MLEGSVSGTAGLINVLKKVALFLLSLFKILPLILNREAIGCKFYATLAYIRHFISAGCYDNDPWYLLTNLRGI